MHIWKWLRSARKGSNPHAELQTALELEYCKVTVTDFAR